jgi:hypothetical protein
MLWKYSIKKVNCIVRTYVLDFEQKCCEAASGSYARGILWSSLDYVTLYV